MRCRKTSQTKMGLNRIMRTLSRRTKKNRRKIWSTKWRNTMMRHNPYSPRPNKIRITIWWEASNILLALSIKKALMRRRCLNITTSRTKDTTISMDNSMMKMHIKLGAETALRTKMGKMPSRFSKPSRFKTR